MDFCTNVTDKLSRLLELHYFFVKLFTLYKTDLKNAATMPVTPRVLFDMYFQYDKVLLSKSEGFLSYKVLKKSFSREKMHVVIWKINIKIKIKKS